MPQAPEYHKPLSVPAKRHVAEAERLAAQARQEKRYYNTWDTAWLKLRAYVLQSEPLCRECKDMKPPLYTPATEVDHIDGDASTMHSNRPDNLQPLCKPHHSAKTARESLERARARVGG